MARSVATLILMMTNSWLNKYAEFQGPNIKQPWLKLDVMCRALKGYKPKYEMDLNSDLNHTELVLKLLKIQGNFLPKCNQIILHV